MNFFQRVQGLARRFAAPWRALRAPDRSPLQRAVALAHGLALLALAGFVALVLYALILIPFTPDVAAVHEARSARPSVLLATNGQVLASYSRAHRQWVDLDHVSPHLVRALVATEDHRFYSHHGIDFRRTLSSIALTLAGDPQGGSTITQQLARNLYPEQIGRAFIISRKLKEMITALKLERRYSKQEILEFYLNSVPFLYNAWGVEAAAQTYFDKPAAQLDVLESATLVGMLKGTYYYNPRIHPERALARRNVVLAQMVRYGALDAAQAARLQKQPLRLDFHLQHEAPGSAPHFAQHVRAFLVDWADEHGYDLYTDGLQIHTTIDARMQTIANRVVARQTAALQAVADVEWAAPSARLLSTDVTAYVERARSVTPFAQFWREHSALVDQFIAGTDEYRKAVAGGQSAEQALAALRADKDFVRRLQADRTRLQAGFVAVEPSTGAVRAWVGSRDFALDQYDHVGAAMRQPGSTFKPFVYAAALRQGIRADHTYPDVAVSIDMPDGTVWQPDDAHVRSGEPVTLRDGLVYSKNNITAQVMQEVGPAHVVRLAQQMGVRQSPLNALPSLALGTSPVTLLEMVNAYATLAADGTYRAPWMIWRISDRNGNVLADFGNESEAVLEPKTAIELTDILREAIDRGTGRDIRSRFGIAADVAGKTGTTQDNADGWFILMHRQLVAGAWVGFNDPRVRMRSSYWGQGAHTALRLVGDFYRQALHARLIDRNAHFARPQAENIFRDWLDELQRRIRRWSGTEAEQQPAPRHPPAAPRRETPAPAKPAPDEDEGGDILRDVDAALDALHRLEGTVRRVLNDIGQGARR